MQNTDGIHQSPRESKPTSELRINEIPAELHRALKMMAVENETTLRQVVIDLLTEGVAPKEQA